MRKAICKFMNRSAICYYLYTVKHRFYIMNRATICIDKLRQAPIPFWRQWWILVNSSCDSISSRSLLHNSCITFVTFYDDFTYLYLLLKVFVVVSQRSGCNGISSLAPEQGKRVARWNSQWQYMYTYYTTIIRRCEYLYYMISCMYKAFEKWKKIARVLSIVFHKWIWIIHIY